MMQHEANTETGWVNDVHAMLQTSLNLHLGIPRPVPDSGIPEPGQRYCAEGSNYGSKVLCQYNF